MHFLKKKVTYNCIEETYEAFSKRDTSFGEESLNSNHHLYFLSDLQKNNNSVGFPLLSFSVPHISVKDFRYHFRKDLVLPSILLRHMPLHHSTQILQNDLRPSLSIHYLQLDRPV